VQLDGDARDLPAVVALGELLLHAWHVHHRRRRRVGRVVGGEELRVGAQGGSPRCVRGGPDLG
jgi:hypothetical protein